MYECFIVCMLKRLKSRKLSLLAQNAKTRSSSQYRCLKDFVMFSEFSKSLQEKNSQDMKKNLRYLG